MDRYVAHMGEKRNACRILVGKRPLGRSRRRLEEYIKMDIREWYGVVWTGSIWLRIRTSGRLL
jgi:hypothetical protein